MSVRLLQLMETGIILSLPDVGDGDGITETIYATVFSYMGKSGIDISAKSIVAVKERGLTRANFAVYDGCNFQSMIKDKNASFSCQGNGCCLN